MSRTIERLQADHREFLRVLAHMESAMDNCLQGEEIDRPLMREFVEYCSGHADTFHHPLEDQLFRCLLARDPQLAPVIRRLEQEHLELRWATRDLREMLDEMQARELVRRDRFLEAMGEYLGLYFHHIQSEEKELFIHARRLLTAEDNTWLDGWLNQAPETNFGHSEALPRLGAVIQAEA
ncbi:hemerythrin domain-containing protein [Gammaproteobacteria bacterium AB-CW1]|uniref:Hemerythrin domain-containing protein n=1 Tax=Natronospira elongata TaxID=3110268 RepID=A0AAP6JH56_9GAMM|nr:hemerythrin domain-containing protein [Gammaproteobacteria bacterium AB-CW1]